MKFLVFTFIGYAYHKNTTTSDPLCATHEIILIYMNTLRLLQNTKCGVIKSVLEYFKLQSLRTVNSVLSRYHSCYSQLILKIIYETIINFLS